MHTVLKCLRNPVDVNSPYEALACLCKKKDGLIAFRLPDSPLDAAQADVIIPLSDIKLERLSHDLKYEHLEIKAGTILGVFPGDIFDRNAHKTIVTPYYLSNLVRDILNRFQYKKRHRIYNIPLYNSDTEVIIT